MRNFLTAALLLTLPFCGSAMVHANRPAPVLHSIFDKSSVLSQPERAWPTAEAMFPPPDLGPVYKFRHSHGGLDRAKYQKLQDAGIILTVIGVVVGTLGGMWVKSENDKADQQRSTGNGRVFNQMNQMAAGFVLGIGIGLTCAGVPILLTHL